MNCIVMFSGGAGSYIAAKRVAIDYGVDNTHLLFTDTLIEDNDLYRFLVEGAGKIFGIDVSSILSIIHDIPPVQESMELRKQALAIAREQAMILMPQLHWVADGRDPWDVFFEKNFLGNNRVAKCSHILKQDMARRYVDKMFHPDSHHVALGIDWSESHRIKAPTESWLPYRAVFPMASGSLITKAESFAEIADDGIDLPRMYLDGFPHNNCGGFCVRAGNGQFAKLLDTNPGLYQYHEEREAEFRDYIGKNVSILRKQKDKVRGPYTMEELRVDIESRAEIDTDDFGGCGCFVD